MVTYGIAMKHHFQVKVMTDVRKKFGAQSSFRSAVHGIGHGLEFPCENILSRNRSYISKYFSYMLVKPHSALDRGGG